VTSINVAYIPNVYDHTQLQQGTRGDTRSDRSVICAAFGLTLLKVWSWKLEEIRS